MKTSIYRRFFCLVCAGVLVCLIICRVTANDVNGAEGANAYLSLNVSTPIDGQVEATVSINNNPGMSGFRIFLSFDKNALTPTSVTAGSVISGLDNNFIYSNLEAFDPVTLDEVCGLWFNTFDVSADGSLFTVKFQATPVAPRETAVNISYAEIANQDLEDIIIINNADIDFITAEIHEQYDASTGSLKIRLNNGFENEQFLSLSVASYDKKNKLLSVVSYPDTPIAPGESYVSFTGITDGEKIKFMLWEDIEPVIGVINIK